MLLGDSFIQYSACEGPLVIVLIQLSHVDISALPLAKMTVKLVVFKHESLYSFALFVVQRVSFF